MHILLWRQVTRVHQAVLLLAVVRQFFPQQLQMRWSVTATTAKLLIKGMQRDRGHETVQIGNDDFPPSWACAFPPITAADSPPLHLPKRVELCQSCVRPRWNTCSWMAWMRVFFHSLEFVQESDLPGCFQDLDTVKRQRDRSWFPLPGAEGKSWADTEEEGVALQGLIAMWESQWKLSLREAWTWGACPLQHLGSAPFLTLGLFPAVFCRQPWAWQEYPKYVSGNRS